MLVIGLAVIFTSCKNQSDPTPISSSFKSSSSERLSNCDKEIATVKEDFLGKHCPAVWNLIYLNAQDNSRLSIPTLISPTLPNTFYWLPNDSLKEYSYDGHLMDSGIWKLINCGGTVILNTTLSGGDNPVTLEEVREDYWQGTFYLPIGPNGSLLLTRVKAYKVK